jgi:hypothetical protein
VTEKDTTGIEIEVHPWAVEDGSYGGFAVPAPWGRGLRRAAIYRGRFTRVREHTAPEPPKHVWRSFEETPWTVRHVAETDA